MSLGYGKRRLVDKVIKDTWGIDDPNLKKYSYTDVLYVLQEMATSDGLKYAEGHTIRQGYQVFTEFVKYLLYRNLANFDSMVLITSPKGTGKSSAAIMLAKEWCRLIGITFNPERHIAYSNADLSKKIDILNHWEPIIADESVRFVTSTDWAKKENRELKKKLAQVRTKHLLYILCFPMKVQKVEKVYLDSLVNYWCTLGSSNILIKDKMGVIRQTKIQDLTSKNPKYEVNTFNTLTNKFEWKKPTKCVLTSKEADVYELELENGTKLSTTKEHLFLTNNGYKKLIDLTKKDEIIMRGKICPNCQNGFIPNREQMLYCSLKCHDKYKQKINKEEIKIQQKKYWDENREELNLKQKESYKKNKKDRLIKASIYRKEHRAYITKWAEDYRNNNRQLVRRRYRENRLKRHEHYLKKQRDDSRRYYETNPNYKLRSTYSVDFGTKLKKQGTKKTKSCMKYLGCTIPEFKQHLEKQFKPGMGWTNNCFKGWHRDHIKPCCKFNLKKESERKICFHYTNFQPLWWYENLQKSGKYDGK